MEILPAIRGHEDLVKLTASEREVLCREIREFLISHVSKTGGHLASNLGVVELSVAIETVFNTSKDRLVFDVGHQSYVHKLLTGRQTDFDRLRMFGGMSGFPKPHESDTDSFVAGHASSSVSIALGMARARKLTGQDYRVVALIGDGAATGGMAYEGLNDAGGSGEPMVIILNENEMSIDRNVGGVAHHLSLLRTEESYFDLKKLYHRILTHLPCGDRVYRSLHRAKERVKRNLLRGTMFEYMGLEYLGPVDGHNMPQLLQVLRAARDMGKPVLVHVRTHKGCGYAPAEKDPSRFHGIGKFHPEDGSNLSPSKQTYSDVFGETMVELARENPRVCAITAAMPSGTGLIPFETEFPQRLFDVGIAEEHAVSMAGGLAKQGAIPVAAIYSTFFQRSYDQIMQDVGLLHLHVVLAVDRAGLVGADGPTHHGVFDVGFLRQVPGMTVLCPASFAELRQMLRWAVCTYDGPVAVRYPRGGEGAYSDCAFTGNPHGIFCHRSGEDATVITYGMISNQVLQAAERLEQDGLSVTVLRLLSVTDLDSLHLEEQIHGNHVIVVEEACTGSGIKESIGWILREKLPGCHVHGMDLGSDFIPHGEVSQLYERAGLAPDSLAKFVREVVGRHEE